LYGNTIKSYTNHIRLVATLNIMEKIKEYIEQFTENWESPFDSTKFKFELMELLKEVSEKAYERTANSHPFHGFKGYWKWFTNKLK